MTPSDQDYQLKHCVNMSFVSRVRHTPPDNGMPYFITLRLLDPHFCHEFQQSCLN